jgi:hypothetical protein
MMQSLHNDYVTHLLKGKDSFVTGLRVQHVSEMYVGLELTVVAVAIGDGQHADDEEDVKDELEEDAARKLLLFPPLSRALQHAL